MRGAIVDEENRESHVVKSDGAEAKRDLLSDELEGTTNDGVETISEASWLRKRFLITGSSGNKVDKEPVDVIGHILKSIMLCSKRPITVELEMQSHRADMDTRSSIRHPGWMQAPGA